MRVLPGARLRVVDADALEEVEHAGAVPTAVAGSVDPQPLGDARPDGGHGVEGAARILRHEPDAAPADAAQPRLPDADQLRAAERDAPSRDGAVAGEEPDHGLRDGRLAGPGLADERRDTPRGDLEGDAVDRAAGARRRPVVHLQVAHGEERMRGIGHASCPPRIDWLMRLVASTTATTTAPGSTVSHHAVAT